MSLKHRVQSLENKLNMNYVSLQLKDGTVHQTTEAKLWNTFFELNAAWSRFDASLAADKRVLGPVPNEVVEAIPLLRAILDTVDDDSGGRCGKPDPSFMRWPESRKHGSAMLTRDEVNQFLTEFSVRAAPNSASRI